MLLPSTRHLDAGATGVPAPATLVDGIVGRWADRPGAPALRDAADVAGSGGGSVAGHRHATGTWWTGGELDAATRAAGRAWRAAGLDPGDRVVWSTRSSVVALVAHLGALRAGLVVVPVSTGATGRELAHVAATVRPAAAVVEDPARAGALERPGVPLLACGPDLAGLPRRRGPGDGTPLDRAAPGDPALVLFTSGTTGAPKGAVLSHANLAAGTASIVAAWRWEPTDRLLHTLPVFHAHGLAVGVYGTLLAGASATLHSGFDAGSVLDAARAGEGTMFFGVPTMYHRLEASGRASDLGRLRLCVSGSAPLAAALHRSLAAHSGNPVLERYGMSETLMLVSNPVDGERRAGTVGFPLPGVEVRLAGGEDTGDEPGAGPAVVDGGEVLVRGPNVFAGYFERPAATAEAFEPDPDGGAPWFRTGDLGVEDGGYLVLRGRRTDLIISGGYNVYPAEVEDVLATHPSVAEVAVTGEPSDEWGETVVAWIVAADGPDEGALAEHDAARLAPYKRPRRYRFVDALPRNAMGKVVRSRLGG